MLVMPCSLHFLSAAVTLSVGMLVHVRCMLASSPKRRRASIVSSSVRSAVDPPAPQVKSTKSGSASLAWVWVWGIW